MRRLEIFGDSFSDPTWTTNSYDSWPELLSEHYEVVNHSHCGSSLWWSYDQYRRNRPDLAVFVVTIPGRLYVKQFDRHMNFHEASWPIAHNTRIGEIYYHYFYDREREQDFHDLMVKDLMTENVLLIPAFDNSGVGSVSLCDISDREKEHYGITQWSSEGELRKCHLSEENNLMISQKIIKALQAGDRVLHLEQSDYVQPSRDRAYYWNG